MFTECNAGYYLNGVVCDPWFSHISGSGGEMLIDGNASSCVTAPQNPDGATVLYVLYVCTAGSDITLNVTMEMTATRNDLKTVLVMAKSGSNCNRFGNHFNVCEVMSSSQVAGKNVCSLKCKCDDSADQCLLYVYKP